MSNNVSSTSAVKTDITDSDTNGATTSDTTAASNSRSTPSSPNNTINGDTRQNLQFRLSATIMNHFQWMNDWSPTSLFQNLLLTNPFRRRNSKASTSGSDIENKRKSADYSVIDKPFAHYLNGTLIPTAKSKELIELANFDILEIDASEPGIGHSFKRCQISTPTWCDSCGEFLWTPVVYDDNQHITSCGQYMQCNNCKYICHLKCRILVRIDCRGVAETPYLLETLSRPSSPIFCETTAFKLRIAKYNQKRSEKGSGLGITVLDELKQTFRGFLRVHLNLTRPINIIGGRRPPSIYDIINEDEASTTSKRRTLTSFYMPRDTVKNIHITSENTSRDVIKAMLKKFKVVDNPQKFALYLCFTDCMTNLKVLKRIGDQEKPLRIQLEYDEDDEEKTIVLQENDTADIAWDAFELPELLNFLKILDREEKEHLTQVTVRYKLLRETIDKIIKAEEQVY